MWLWLPSEVPEAGPTPVIVCTVGLELSPQSTVTVHGLSGPASENEPRLNESAIDAVHVARKGVPTAADEERVHDASRRMKALDRIGVEPLVAVVERSGYGGC